MNRRSRLAALAATVVLGATISLAGAGSASAAYNSKSWSAWGSAYTSVSATISGGCGFWTCDYSASNVRNYTRDFGADRSRVDGVINFGKVTGSINISWPPGASATVSGSSCKATSYRFSSTNTSMYHSGVACSVSSPISAWFNNVKTTGTHWSGSHSRSTTVTAS